MLCHCCFRLWTQRSLKRERRDETNALLLLKKPKSY